MDIPGKSFPGFVHEAAAFVQEAATILIDHDPIGVDQHDRRGALAARIDRFDVHAVPVAGDARALIRRDADAVAGVETCSRRDELDGFGGGAEMRAHHFGIALKSARGENHGVSVERGRSPVADWTAMPLTHWPSAMISPFASCS